MGSQEHYAVGARSYSYYTRYPDHRWAEGYPKEAEDLCCPKCGCDRIAITAEADGSIITTHNLGDVAQCWECQHEFTVTENCWKWRKIGN